MVNNEQAKQGIMIGELNRNEVSYLNKIFGEITLHEVKLKSPKSILKFKRALGARDGESNEFLKTTVECLKPKDFNELLEDKTDEGKAKIAEITNSINEEYNRVAQEYMNEIVKIETDPIELDDLFAISEKNDGINLGLVEYISGKFSNE